MLTNHCFVCGHDNRYVLQKHHIIPRRVGGSDKNENLVRLCPNCHEAIEKIYNNSFYHSLGVTISGDEDAYETVLRTSRSALAPKEADDLKTNTNLWGDAEKRERNKREYDHAIENLAPQEFWNLTPSEKFIYLSERWGNSIDEELNNVYRTLHPDIVARRDTSPATDGGGSTNDSDSAERTNSEESDTGDKSVQERMVELGVIDESEVV